MAKYSPKILVVDDNEDNRYTLHRRLKKDGYSEISLANGGQEALDIVYEESFDLILLDLMMPDISGLEVLQQVKSDPDLRHIPVIMVTASDDVESAAECIQSGADDFPKGLSEKSNRLPIPVRSAMTTSPSSSATWLGSLRFVSRIPRNGWWIPCRMCLSNLKLPSRKPGWKRSKP